MRFAFISTMHGSPWGGSEELWSQTAIQLKRAGHEVHASVGYWPQLSAKVTGLPQQGIELEIHASQQTGSARRIWNKLSFDNRRSHKRMLQLDPDLVVISQGHNSGGFEWARVCREAAIPYAIIVHCNSEHWWFQGEFAEAVATYTGACGLFCVCRHNLDLLRLQVGEPLLNAELVRNPYNVSHECPPDWPDERSGWRLACVARIDLAAKGQDLLLQTLAKAEWRDRPFELNLFGAGPDETALRRMAQTLHLNNVHFRGHVSDVSAIWAKNHLLVLPSRYEGLPLALVEAMWFGRPAVVTDVGGNAELCFDDETGFVSPAPTLSSFSHTLERAWEQRKRWPDLGRTARDRLQEQVPRDPVAVFCERLKAVAAGQSAGAVAEPSASR